MPFSSQPACGSSVFTCQFCKLDGLRLRPPNEAASEPSRGYRMFPFSGVRMSSSTLGPSWTGETGEILFVYNIFVQTAVDCRVHEYSQHVCWDVLNAQNVPPLHQV